MFVDVVYQTSVPVPDPLHREKCSREKPEKNVPGFIFLCSEIKPALAFCQRYDGIHIPLDDVPSISFHFRRSFTVQFLSSRDELTYREEGYDP